MFQHLPAHAGAPILGLNGDFQRAPRADKVNLSIGIYFDGQGRLPVLAPEAKGYVRYLKLSGVEMKATDTRNNFV